MSELVYPDLPIEEQTWADSAVWNIDESNIDDSSVSIKDEHAIDIIFDYKK